MTSEHQHITVCVCTYKRPRLLKRLLDEVGRQESDGRFTYSIVLADNDHLESGKEVVSDFAAASKVRVQYCVEARQNIALARNKAVENATGDFVAFIDDDEFPATRWLLTLFEACHAYEVVTVSPSGSPAPLAVHVKEASTVARASEAVSTAAVSCGG